MSSEVLRLIGRSEELFSQDLDYFRATLSEIVSNSRFLVVGEQELSARQ